MYSVEDKVIMTLCAKTLSDENTEDIIRNLANYIDPDGNNNNVINLLKDRIAKLDSEFDNLLLCESTRRVVSNIVRNCAGRFADVLCSITTIYSRHLSLISSADLAEFYRILIKQTEFIPSDLEILSSRISNLCSVRANSNDIGKDKNCEGHRYLELSVAQSELLALLSDASDIMFDTIKLVNSLPYLGGKTIHVFCEAVKRKIFLNRCLSFGIDRGVVVDATQWSCGIRLKTRDGNLFGLFSTHVDVVKDRIYLIDCADRTLAIRGAE